MTRRSELLGLVSLTMSLTAAVAAAQPTQETAPAAEVPLVARPLPDAKESPLVVLKPVAGGLTSSQVARRTVASSATVRARQAEVEVAEAKFDQTTVQYFPRVGLKATYTRLSPVSSGFGSGALVGAGNPGLLTTGPCPGGVGVCVLDSAGQPVGAAAFEIESLKDNYALTASAAIPLSDYVTKLSHAAAAAQATRRAARLATRAERLKVQAEAKVLYYTWVRSLGQVAVAQKSLDRTRARQTDAAAGFSLGSISKADLMRLEALVANTEFAVKEGETMRSLAARQLQILMGDKSSASYQVGEDVLVPATAEVRGGLDGLSTEALSRRLELAALDQTARSLRSGAKAVGAGAYPQLEAFGDITYANPNPRYFPARREWNSTWAVGLSASWTVTEAFSTSAAARELSASARNIEAQAEALRNAIRQEVAAAYLDRERARVAIQTSQRAARAAEEAYRVATDLYRVGRATTTELIEAELDLLNARLAELNAHIGLRIAEVRLSHAVGRDVPAGAGG